MPNVSGFSVADSLHVTLMAPRDLRWGLDFWTVCAPLLPAIPTGCANCVDPRALSWHSDGADRIACPYLESNPCPLFRSLPWGLKIKQHAAVQSLVLLWCNKVRGSETCSKRHLPYFLTELLWCNEIGPPCVCVYLRLALGKWNVRHSVNRQDVQNR
jgi:hypothetical protein